MSTPLSPLTVVRHVQLSLHHDVARIVLDRPERSNALDPTTVEALHEALARAEDSGAAIVVLSSRGRAFCGGLDLTGLEHETDASLLLRLCRIQLLLERVQSMAVPTVAVVAGAAVGAGADLALACSIRLGLPGASLRFPGSGFGAVLGVARLAAHTSPSYAAEVGLTARRLDAAEADRQGLWRVLEDPSAVDAEVDRLATAAARLPAGTAGRLRRAAGPVASDPLGDLVRSLVGEPGLAARVSAYRDRTTHPSPEGARA